MAKEEKPSVSCPVQQEDLDDDLPDLLDVDYDSDTDSEGVPELVGDVSDDDDDMPPLSSDSDDDLSDDEPPPLVKPVTSTREIRPGLVVESLAYENVPEEYLTGFTGMGKKSTLPGVITVTSNGAGKSSRPLKLSPENTVLWCTRNELSGQQPEKLKGSTAVGNLRTDLPGSDGSAVINDSKKSKALPGMDDTAVAKAVECSVASTGLAHRRLVKGVECPLKSTATNEAKQAELQEWSTGLFDCFEDMPTCLLGAFCPSILYGKTRSLVNRVPLPCAIGTIYHFISMMTGTLMFGCPLAYGGLAPMTATPVRMFIREEYGLKGTTDACPGNGLLGDFAVHYCCHACALCQEHREMKFRKATEEEKGGTHTSPPVVEEMEKRVAVEPTKSLAAEEDAGGIYYPLPAGENN